MYYLQIFPIVLLIKFKSVKQIKEVTSCQAGNGLLFIPFSIGEGPAVSCRENHSEGRQEYLRAHFEAGGRIQTLAVRHHPRRGQPDADNSPDTNQDRAGAKQNIVGPGWDHLVKLSPSAPPHSFSLYLS